MSQVIGHALVVNVESAPRPLEDGVYLFATKEEAKTFAIEKLIGIGYAYESSGKLFVASDPVLECTADELLDFYDEEKLTSYEHFNVREIKAVGNQELITWHDTNESKPDADIDVLLQTDSDSCPVWPGNFDGLRWSFCDGGTPRIVTHWAEMPNGREVQSCKS